MKFVREAPQRRSASDAHKHTQTPDHENYKRNKTKMRGLEMTHSHPVMKQVVMFETSMF